VKAGIRVAVIFRLAVILRCAAVGFVLASGLAACSAAGPTWTTGTPHNSSVSRDPTSFQPPSADAPAERQSLYVQRIRAAAEPDPHPNSSGDGTADGSTERQADPGGRVLGIFRNTYYNFPSERDYGGESVGLFDSQCKLLARVPAAFHDTLCVQGSGRLASGATVSFARRNCRCARRCPRTNQYICFDRLDAERYPWGRGSAGQAITPLLSVAVDKAVIPLGSSLYIPEFVGLPRETALPRDTGLPRETAQSSSHDGCFVAEDEGLKVRGKHVDIFTGKTALTRLWDQLVPTNQGVTVILDSPVCAH
jgi:3D (Asp-Asp-Asp) domain-containing protein